MTYEVGNVTDVPLTPIAAPQSGLVAVGVPLGSSQMTWVKHCWAEEGAAREAQAKRERSSGHMASRAGDTKCVFESDPCREDRP